MSEAKRRMNRGDQEKGGGGNKDQTTENRDRKEKIAAIIDALVKRIDDAIDATEKYVKKENIQQLPKIHPETKNINEDVELNIEQAITYLKEIKESLLNFQPTEGEYFNEENKKTLTNYVNQITYLSAYCDNYIKEKIDTDDYVN